jgi:cytochrome c peroxidase
LKSRLIIFALFSFILSGAFLLDSCKRDRLLPERTPLNFVVPPGFPQPVFSFQNILLTEQGFLLGRKLFYDGRLSKDGNFPCASCHQQVAAFTTFEHDRSHGYNHSHTLRNAPGLANLAWYPYYLQDGSATSLSTIYQNHITASNEMAETVANVIAKLKDDTAYQRMFSAAFNGDASVTSDHLFNALTQFVINLVSANSKYDKVVLRGEGSFTAQEQNGYQLFKTKCASCHTEPLFTDFSFRNVGLALDNSIQDFGRMRVTHNPSDSLKFRVPSLRNAELTSYYTHDGRLSVMRMMIQHYKNGIIQSPTLDPSLVNGIQTTLAEENDLVAFLRTLSDSSYLTNPRFKE